MIKDRWTSSFTYNSLDLSTSGYFSNIIITLPLCICLLVRSSLKVHFEKKAMPILVKYKTTQLSEEQDEISCRYHGKGLHCASVTPNLSLSCKTIVCNGLNSMVSANPLNQTLRFISGLPW